MAFVYIAIALILAGVSWVLRGLIVSWLELLLSKVAGTGGKDGKIFEGNFGPVKEELLEGDLPVEGVLPAAFDGAYVRNGPNPYLQPVGGLHWFDGDGMLHAVRIKDGKAAYSNAYVQTSRHKQERKAGRPLFLTLGQLNGRAGLFSFLLEQLKEKLGIINTKEGAGTANTALAFHNNQLLALHEGDLPIAVRVHNDAHIETLERQTYGGRIKQPFTAHPKIDPVTGDLHGIGYSFSKPSLHYFVVSSNGSVKLDIDVPLPDPVMMHDMAITEDYAIFLDFPMLFDPKSMAQGKPILRFKGERATRIGVFPKYAEDAGEIRWFELPASYAFHVANAWQEGNIIRIFLSLYEEGYDVFGILEKQNLCSAYLSEIRVDLESGKASQRRVADVPNEFPTVPDALVGRKTQYAYLAMFDDKNDANAAGGIAKIDLLAGSPAAAVAAQIRFGRGRSGGEAVFIPRSMDVSKMEGEDDGYLALYLYDAATNGSEFVVYDARSFSEKPVARVRLPQRVPQGFHGKHVNAEQFHSQFPFDIHFLPNID